LAALEDSTAGSTEQWFGLQGSNLSGSLTLPAVSATLANLALAINTASGKDAGNVAATPIGWSTVNNSGLTLSGDQKSASGDLTALNIADLVSGSLSFAISKTTVTQGTLLTLALSNLALQIGTAGFGLSITGGTLKLAALDDGATGSSAQWFGLQGSNLSGSLTLPAVSATIANLALAVNTASGID